MIIGTAGHIDHGKTALVKALTGVDADRLPEEKRRGITIDLGYAYTCSGALGGLVGFIDVPGHERFVHSMLAGASGIDAALIVVALDDGIKPQTIEHLQILDLLGIHAGVVALTKLDRAPDRVTEVSAQLRSRLAGTALADAVMVAVSARTGQGIAELAQALRALRPRPRHDAGYPRLAVDRAFTLTGAGLVVTGTLVAGRIAVEDRLLLSPSGNELRVRGLHAQNRPAQSASAGQRVALNIVGPKLRKDSVTRGDWVLHPELHAPTVRLDARLHLLAGETRALRSGSVVHLHLGAAHVSARVVPLSAERLAPGATDHVRLTLDQPIGALAGDRLVLRDAGASRPVAGGEVVDPFPPVRGRRTPTRLAQLIALAEADPAIALRAVLAVAPGWVDRRAFCRARNLTADAQPAILRAAEAVPLGGLAIGAERLTALQDELLRALVMHHQAMPDQPVVHSERLRLALGQRLPPADFAALLDRLRRDGAIVWDGTALRLPSHRVALSAADERVWPAVRQLIAAGGFRPPRTRDLAQALGVAEPAMRATLKRLQRVGRLIEVAPDHFFLRETVARMAAIAAELASGAAGLTASSFRDRLDNGRKVAIQVLEYFDRAGLTVRCEDHRQILPDRLDLFGPLA